MKKNKTLLISLPFALILLSIAAYEYGYLGIEEEVSSIQEEQVAKRKTLGKYEELIAEKPDVEKKITELKEQRKADDSKIITGQTPSLAAATLQETVRGIVIGRGGSISSERVGKPEDYGKFKIISVSIDAVLPDPRTLSDILFAIETRTPYLMIKEFESRVRNFREPKEIMIKLDVSALYGGK